MHTTPLDLDGNGTNDIQFAATSNNIKTTFSNLASRLTSNDLLLHICCYHMLPLFEGAEALP